MPFAVTPKTDCPHVDHCADRLPQITRSVRVPSPPAHPPCVDCESTDECWLCLSCGEFRCSRYVCGHALDHFNESKHAVSVSLSDLSSWCYECDTYIVDDRIRPVLQALHIELFGEPSAAYRERSADGAEATPGAESTSAAASSEASSSPSGPDASREVEGGGDPPRPAVAAAAAVEETVTENNGDGDPSSGETDDGGADGGDPSSGIAEMLRGLALGRGYSGAGDGSGEDGASAAAPVLPEATLHGLLTYIRERKPSNILVFSGAGVSTSCGIPDFRSPGTGLYDNLQKYNLPHPTAVFDLSYFRSNPRPFYTLARELFPGNYTPSPTHYFVRLLHDMGVLRRCYTQNIDTLERVAGLPAEVLVEAHGSFSEAACIDCGDECDMAVVREAIFSPRDAAVHGGDGEGGGGRDEDDTAASDVQIPSCTSCGGLVKPKITFFGENLPERFFRLQSDDLAACDLAIVMGSSLLVNPFAGVPGRLPPHVPRVLINRDKVGVRSGPEFQFDEPGNTRDVFLQGSCDDVTRRICTALGWDEDLDALIAQSSISSSPGQGGVVR